MRKKISGIYASKTGGIVYYSCTHPATKKHLGLGSNYVVACKIYARLLAEYPQTSEDKIWQRIEGKNTTTLAQFVPEYVDTLIKRGVAKATLKNKGCMIRNVVIPALGDLPLNDIRTKHIADMLKNEAARGNHAQALLVKTLITDMLGVAISLGLIDSTHNPAKIARSPEYTVSRSRLSLDQFRLVYNAASRWDRAILELAVATSHASVTDMTALHWPIDGWLLITRQKTGESVKLPLGLRLEALNLELGSVIDQFRDGIQSDYILHARFDRGKIKAGDKLSSVYISTKINTLIKSVGIDWGDKTPATLYELRSLAVRLYDKQGGIDTQILAAHKSESSTYIYRDVRGSEIKELKI